MSYDRIQSVRILPSDKKTFPTEKDFKFFIETTLAQRGGYYYFPSQMMKCPKDTFILFQYNGMIRATGVLIDKGKKPIVDERGVKYSGFYQFDVNTLHYLKAPIDKDLLKRVYPEFVAFNQTKQSIPDEYWPDIFILLHSQDSFYPDNSNEIVKNIEIESVALGLVGKMKETFVKVRVNQGVFRSKLLLKNSRCCLCGVSNPTLLIASHIKPWSRSDPFEKMDIDNGFLMCPNHDRLFDQGLITFAEDGEIIISNNLSHEDCKYMHIHNGLSIQLTDRNKEYLKYHREYVFDKNKG